MWWALAEAVPAYFCHPAKKIDEKNPPLSLVFDSGKPSLPLGAQKTLE
jgi:hypothetical protein